jgi:hypothetical protein
MSHRDCKCHQQRIEPLPEKSSRASFLVGCILITTGYLLQGPDGGVKDKHTFEIILFACLALGAIAVSRIRRRRT